MNIRKALIVAGIKAKKVAPHAMVVLGIGGIIYTLVDACIKSRKLDEQIEEEVEAVEAAKEEFEAAEEEYEVADTEEAKAAYKAAKKIFKKAKRNLYKKIGRCYLKTIVLGLLSIALIGGSHVMLTEKLITTTAALVAIETDYNDYRAAVREKYGQEAEDEIMYGRQLKDGEMTVKDPETGEDVKKPIKVAKWREGHSVYAMAFCKSMCGSMFADNHYYDSQTISNMVSMLEKTYERDKIVFAQKAYEYMHHPVTKEIIGAGWIKGARPHDDEIRVSVIPTVFEFVPGEMENGYIIDFNVIGKVENYLYSVVEDEAKNEELI